MLASRRSCVECLDWMSRSLSSARDSPLSRGFSRSRSTFVGCDPLASPILFETIASVVPFQQLSLESGVTLLNRLVQTFGESVQHDALHAWVFPSARSVAGATVADVRGCGFSSAKAHVLKNLAMMITHGELTEIRLAELPTADLLATLDELPGLVPGRPR